VVLVGVVIAALVTGGKNTPAAKVAAVATTAATAPPAVCPLTGAPAPGGVVPARPALGVKIGNYPGDRPSSGLNQADIVFEEPVEGAITRLLAVFQCQGSRLVGDLRSAREPDAGILSQLSHPLFVHAGGIDPADRAAVNFIGTRARELLDHMSLDGRALVNGAASAQHDAPAWLGRCILGACFGALCHLATPFHGAVTAIWAEYLKETWITFRDL